MSIGFLADVRRERGSPAASEPTVTFTITARPDAGPAPTREEVMAICVALGRRDFAQREVVQRVESDERDNIRMVTTVYEIEPLLALVGRVSLRWQAARQATVRVEVPIPISFVEKVYATLPEVARVKIDQAIGRELWDRLYASRAREDVLFEVVKRELARL